MMKSALRNNRNVSVTWRRDRGSRDKELYSTRRRSRLGGRTPGRRSASASSNRAWQPAGRHAWASPFRPLEISFQRRDAPGWLLFPGKMVSIRVLLLVAMALTLAIGGCLALFAFFFVRRLRQSLRQVHQQLAQLTQIKSGVS